MSEEYPVILPKLGESIMNATIVQWFKKEGELIKKDEPLLEVATDKVNSEIPSPVSGVVKKILAQADEELSVGDPLAIIDQEGKEEVAAPSMVPEEEKRSQEDVSDQSDYYSPAVLRIAREKKISFEELEKIKGSGTGGRITKKDLEDYVARGKKPCPAEALPSGEGIEHIQMSGMRKAIAQNLVRSFYEAPHASLIAEVDVTELMKRLKEEKEAFLSEHGYRLTITSFVARALGRALREYPLLNSSLRNDTIVLKHFMNLGIAVSIEGGLVVPVIRHCEQMTLSEIAKSVSVLAQKARENALQPDDVKEGTITMTNFGMSGILIGTPIIRYPEVAIVGLGAISKKVVALDDDTFGVHQVMNICLTFDHRVIDGMYGCGFLASLKKHLEKDLEID